jgi:hypothetical protein
MPRRQARLLGLVVVTVAAACVLAWLSSLVWPPVHPFWFSSAHAAGQYPDGKLHAWFDKLASGKGLCCSFADGRTLSDPDWGTHDDHYWVIIDRIRYAVPADAVVAAPNVFGRAVVWPYMDEQGQTLIRCFLPGGGV